MPPRFELGIEVLQTFALPLGYGAISNCNHKNISCGLSDSYGNRTRVTAVKGRCLNRLTTGPLFSSSVAEPFLILSYNFYNCKSFFLILSIFLLKFFTVFYDFLKLIFYSFFENISYVPYSIVLSLIYTAKLPAG